MIAAIFSSLSPIIAVSSMEVFLRHGISSSRGSIESIESIDMASSSAVSPSSRFFSFDALSLHLSELPEFSFENINTVQRTLIIRNYIIVYKYRPWIRFLFKNFQLWHYDILKLPILCSAIFVSSFAFLNGNMLLSKGGRSIIDCFLSRFSSMADSES